MSFFWGHPVRTFTILRGEGQISLKVLKNCRLLTMGVGEELRGQKLRKICWRLNGWSFNLMHYFEAKSKSFKINSICSNCIEAATALWRISWFEFVKGGLISESNFFKLIFLIFFILGWIVENFAYFFMSVGPKQKCLLRLKEGLCFQKFGQVLRHFCNVLL